MRRARFESLEPRLLLTAEGDVFPFSQVITAAGLSGNLSAAIAWGDGFSTPAAVSTSGNGSVKVRIDYRFDSQNFFDTQLKKNVLASAVDSVVSRLGDDLTAIVPGGSNTWRAKFTHPGTGAKTEVSNLTIAANEIVLFVGGRNLEAGVLASGGFGGYTAEGSSAFLSAVTTRGEGTVSGPAARDFATWGGALSFSKTIKWHFGETTAGLDSDEVDFLTVAAHEMGHVLGFGMADSWDNLVVNFQFSGSRSVAEYDGVGNVPLDSSARHWAEGVTDGGREVAMVPVLNHGTRKVYTALDFAGLDDLGWDVLSPVATVTGSHRYADNRTYSAQVTLSDDLGGVLTRSFQAVISNVAPTLTVAEGWSTLAGIPVTVKDIGTFTDPGFSNGAASPPTVETFTYEINWGDGSAASTGTASGDTPGGPGVLTQGSFDGSHTYTAAGVYTVQVSVRDDDGGSDTHSIQVQVIAPPPLELRIADSAIAENAGPAATFATVSRLAADSSQPLVVTLYSSDPSEAAIVSSVTIPAGQASATFAMDAVDDALLDGEQTVTLSAVASGFTGATAILTVTDHETLTVMIDPTSVVEDVGPAAAMGRVTRSNTDIALPLTVSLISSDHTEASVALEVIVPAGQSYATFVVDAVDDDQVDGTQTVMIEASADGYESGSATLQVLVSVVVSWQNPSNACDVDNNGRVEPLDVLALINDINHNSGRVLPERSPKYLHSLFLDVNGDGQVSPEDVLEVVNSLNASAAGEGEPPKIAAGSASAAVNEPASRDVPPRSDAFEHITVGPREQRSDALGWSSDAEWLDVLAQDLSARSRRQLLAGSATSSDPLLSSL